jgi:uncharacterized protein (TIRG00374 family)
VLRAVLLVLGSLTLLFLVWQIGPGRIYEAAIGLGPAALVLILLPSVVMYAVEAYGWLVTLGGQARGLPFWRLWAVRTAGEVINMTTPTAYVGGEPLKAYLLKRYGVPMVEGMASVVIAKTTMTIAQVLFMLTGIAGGMWLLWGTQSVGTLILGGLLSLGLLLFGLVGFIAVQRHGIFTGILGLLRTLGLRLAYLEQREDKLRQLDQTILEFYSMKRPIFYLSTGLFLLGWLADAAEVYAMLYFLGGPVDVLTALSVCGVAELIKGGTFFIPGSLGAQDGGNLLLLKAFGYSDVTGITFALLRRFRELVWIGLGLLCIALVGVREGGEQGRSC